MKLHIDMFTTSAGSTNAESAQGRIPLPVKKKETNPASGNRVVRTDAIPPNPKEGMIHAS